MANAFSNERVKYLARYRAVVLNAGSLAAHQGLMFTLLRPTIHLLNIFSANCGLRHCPIDAKWLVANPEI